MIRWADPEECLSIGYRDEPLKIEVVRTNYNRCSCGRFVSKGGRCSLEIKVYREGTFMGWEHY